MSRDAGAHWQAPSNTRVAVARDVRGKERWFQGEERAPKSSKVARTRWEWHSTFGGGFLRYSERGLVGATGWLTGVRSTTVLALFQVGASFGSSQFEVGNFSLFSIC